MAAARSSLVQPAGSPVAGGWLASRDANMGPHGGSRDDVHGSILSSLGLDKDGGDTTTTALFVTLLAIACSLWGYQALLAGPPGLQTPMGGSLRVLRGWIPALGQTSFYGKAKKDWVKAHIGALDQPREAHGLRMNLRKYIITLVHGVGSAKDFFGSRHLNFYAGYGTLFSGIEIPNTPSDEIEPSDPKGRTIDITKPPPANSTQRSQWSIKHLRNCLSNRRLTEHGVMAKVAADCWQGLDDIWKKDGVVDASGADKGKTGLINMHEQLYKIMFRVSVRIVGAEETAEEEDLTQMMSNYWAMENNQSYTNTMLASLPTPSNKLRKAAAHDLQAALKAPIEARAASGERRDDYIQILLDSGATPFDATIWVTGMLFASIINTSSMFAWTIALASADREIWAKMRGEIDETLDRLSKENGLSPRAPIADKVAALSIEQLEDNFGYTYWCIRETIRIMMVDFAYRRNDCPGDSITVDGQPVRQGEYLAFCMGTLHRDERIYADPERYDPDRWVRGEASKPYEFMGWGGGLHPCVGMKLAKNELKMALAMFVGTNDFAPVDEQGNVYTRDTIPLPDLFRGGYRLPSKPLFLKYTVRHG